MVTPITFQAEVDQSRRLTLPDDVPLGPVEVIIRPLAATFDDEREAFRAKLRALGLLAEGPFAPPDAVELSEVEREAIGRLFIGQRSMDALIDEDRRDRGLA